MNKRILSILLCLMLVLSLLVMAVPVSAASDSATVTVTADKTEAKPGDEITFTVVIGPVEELAAFDFKIDIPDGLTLGEVTTDSGAKSALGSSVMAVDLVKDEGTVKAAMFAMGNFDVASDVTLGTFKCTVADDASGEKTFSLVADFPNAITDENDTNKDIGFVSDNVTISSGETTAPVDPTDAPVDPTDAPVDPTDAPQPTDAPHVHDLQHFDEVPATVEAEGLKEHYYCAGCNKYFSDATAAVEVTYESLIIPKLTPPTEPPVVEPTDAPVEPTDAPVEPTDAPVEPTDAPVVEPTDAPVVEPTDAPVVEPTDAPVVEPTEAPASAYYYFEKNPYEYYMATGGKLEMAVLYSDTEAADYDNHVMTHFVKWQINGVDIVPENLGGTGNAKVLIAESKAVVAANFKIGANEIKAYFDDSDEPAVTTLIVYDENGSSVDQSSTKDSSTKDSSTKDSSTKDSSTTSPKTGDATHMYLWLIITLASMAGVVGVLYTAKRKGIFTK